MAGYGKVALSRYLSHYYIVFAAYIWRIKIYIIFVTFHY